MKTSNKLLTALAALLIIIPIIVVAINVKINYRPATGENFVEEQEINTEPFDKESSGRTSIPIKTPFNSVNIPDAKRNVLQIHFIKSAISGIKVPTEMKNEISFSVNNMGILQINIGDKLNTSGYHKDGIAILVYGPNINDLSLNNSTSLVLTAKTDTLNVNMKRSGSISFGSPITFSVNEKVTRVINQTDIKQLNVNLDSASFYSSNSSYKNLTISSKNSSVDIRGDENSKNSIGNLTINTFEKSDIKIEENVMVNKISGNLSDETTIAMPVKYLKQMLKN